MACVVRIKQRLRDWELMISHLLASGAARRGSGKVRREGISGGQQGQLPAGEAARHGKQCWQHN
jgi:hypothetical protein